MTVLTCFLQVKAFGDLVIANAAADRVVAAERSRLSLAVGRHLLPLCEAISPTMRLIELDTAEAGVPAIFDVKRHGIVAALQSALQVRDAVSRAPLDPSTCLLFDRLGRREHFIAAGRPAIAMAAVENIYKGYDLLLAGMGFMLTPARADSTVGIRRIGIFPGSRIAAKNLPVSLVGDLMRDLERRGVVATLFLLDGERADLEASGLPHRIVPRQFTALRDAIASNDAIVSADSLPAHLAEGLAIKSVVLTPRPNAFWMPWSVFSHRRWYLFDDPDNLACVAESLSL